mgnify:CR=1 FL=1
MWLSRRSVCVCFFQADDGIRGYDVTGVQTCALPILRELDRRGVSYRLVETGQHGAYLPVLRERLGIREPDVRLGGDADADTVVAAVRWALGLAGLLLSRRRLRSRVFGDRDGVCLVHGDTPSTLLATLMARRAGQIGRAHV